MKAVAILHFFTFHFSLSERSVAHAARGAQSRDDGGDDAADNLEDGLPRFLVFHSLCFLSFLVSVN